MYDRAPNELPPTKDIKKKKKELIKRKTTDINKSKDSSRLHVKYKVKTQVKMLKKDI